MARANVCHNGKWACFSHIANAFITEFMEKSVYEEWRRKEYGRADLMPAEQCCMMTMEEAVCTTRTYYNHDETVKFLEEAGLSQEEAEKLAQETEEK